MKLNKGVMPLILSIILAIGILVVIGSINAAECGSQDCSGSMSLVLGNSAPVITFVNITGSSTVVLNGGTTKTVYVIFNVTDNNGYADINSSTSNVTFSKPGETTRGSASSCVNLANTTLTSQFNCTVSLQFYDGAGSWIINATIDDSNQSDSSATNGSINATVSALDYVSQDVSAVSWTSVTTGTNDQEAAAAMVLTNGGNQNYTNISIKGFDATGGSNSEVIFAENFSVDPDTGQSSGQVYMVNDTYTDVAVLTGLTNYGASSTENVYFYVDTSSGLQPDTFTSDSSWSILVSA
ncbi:hypothetical protein GOV14_02945 [Candidatus Pacearchaeota archaeon]|nr:hypothetical protein [Candidatus Pacearchaeota archaeon]